MIVRFLPIYTVFILAITGCSSTSPQIQLDRTIVQPLLFDTIKVETEEEIFQLTPDITQKLDLYIKLRANKSTSQAKKIMAFLTDNQEGTISYQKNANLVATEAFNNLNANCLSLSILTYSLAKHLGMNTQFQKVHIPEYWDTSKGYSLLTGHVNIKISPSDIKNDAKHIYFGALPSSVIDFDPYSRQEDFPITPIGKSRILAMFYNNKGAIHLINQNYNEAFSYFQHAIKADPYYSGTWANLGILYRVHGYFDIAERSYAQAYKIDKNKTAWGNLALLYRKTGRIMQASNIENKLESIRKSNPYYQIAKGNEALSRNELHNALTFYKKATNLNSMIHDGYFGMARVYMYLGDYARSKLYLKKARSKAQLEHDRTRYDSKLSGLKSYQAKLSR